MQIKKYHYFLFILPLLSFLTAMSSVASAQGIDNIDTINIRANANLESQTKGNETSTEIKASVRGDVTNTTTQENRATSTDENNNNNTGTTKEDNRATSTETSANENINGQLTAEEHRSTVASFVKSLLDIADRERGDVGTQVRVVARAQNDSASTTSDAIAKIDNRGKLQTLLWGDDYSTLGQLRAEVVTTQNNIDQLKALLPKTTNNTDKAELSAKIKVLEDSQIKVNAFINAHENSFSFFGWFVKLFTK